VLIGEKKTPRPDENLSSIEHCVQNIKEEACEIDIEETALPDPLDVHQEPISSEDKIVIEVPSVQTAIKTQTTQAKTTHKSVKRAAAETKIAKDNPKRAKIEQNVPKAEVSEDNNPKSIEPVDSDEIFGKVKIEFEELQRILEDRRNKESFKSMKYKCDSCVLGFTDYNRLQEHNTSFHDE
ncbi:jg26220, partial [Pararge aegeria aegeria]